MRVKLKLGKLKAEIRRPGGPGSTPAAELQAKHLDLLENHPRHSGRREIRPSISTFPIVFSLCSFRKPMAEIYGRL